MTSFHFYFFSEWIFNDDYIITIYLSGWLTIALGHPGAPSRGSLQNWSPPHGRSSGALDEFASWPHRSAEGPWDLEQNLSKNQGDQWSTLSWFLMLAFCFCCWTLTSGTFVIYRGFWKAIFDRHGFCKIFSGTIFLSQWNLCGSAWPFTGYVNVGAHPEGLTEQKLPGRDGTGRFDNFFWQSTGCP